MITSSQSALEFYANEYHLLRDGDPEGYGNTLIRLLEKLQWKGDIKSFRDALPYDLTTLGFTDFLNIISHLGYPPEIVKTSLHKVNQDMIPCLFVRENETGPGRLVLEPVSEEVWGLAYVFQKQNRSKKRNDTAGPDKRSWFRSIALRFKGVLAQILVASLLINLLALVTPLFMMSVYDMVIGKHAPELLQYLLAGVVLALGVEYVLRFLRTRSLAWFGARIDHIVSIEIVGRLLALPARYTEGASVASQIARLKAFESVREFFSGAFFVSIIEAPFTILLIIALALISPALVVIPLLVLGAYVILYLAARPALKEQASRLAQASTERETMHIETLGKLETLRASGGYDAWSLRYEKVSARASYEGYRFHKLLSIIDAMSQGFVVLAGIAVIYIGVMEIREEEMTVGAMIAAIILTWRILSPMQFFFTAAPRVVQVRKNIEQINRLMDLPDERTLRELNCGSESFKGKIEFHNVGLRYSKEVDPVYAGLTFTVQPGECIAITGANSSGKSTTLKLVSGLYQPQAGSVRIDNSDIRQINPTGLRQNIAYVEQKAEIFNTTLRENLLYVKPEATEENLVQALSRAGLEEWLKGLPEGLDTSLTRLEKRSAANDIIVLQIALARAYLHDSPILLFDEMPYEFLNSNEGKLFFDYLKAQKGKKTILFITYRQDYIDLADMVIELHPDKRPQVRRGRYG